MDYERCVAHHIRGRYKGQRCKRKGTYICFGGGLFKVCLDHYNYYDRFAPAWAKDILTRGILGRYDNGA